MPDDESKIKRWRKSGRYSHFGAILSIGAAMAPFIYKVGREYPVITSIIGVVTAFCIYHNWIQGYNASYEAQADFIIGERKSQ
ncbi:hypothetical protein JXA85_04205 [Candidatus Woesearchaeota archaeon]|nr:hypothetical protein [Candidatus Woesearchaeota archaeon]